MCTSLATATEAGLAAFSDAWSRHDIDVLLSFMPADRVLREARPNRPAAR